MLHKFKLLLFLWMLGSNFNCSALDVDSNYNLLVDESIDQPVQGSPEGKKRNLLLKLKIAGGACLLIILMALSKKYYSKVRRGSLPNSPDTPKSSAFGTPQAPPPTHVDGSESSLGSQSNLPSALPTPEAPFYEPPRTLLRGSQIPAPDPLAPVPGHLQRSSTSATDTLWQGGLASGDTRIPSERDITQPSFMKTSTSQTPVTGTLIEPVAPYFDHSAIGVSERQVLPSVVPSPPPLPPLPNAVPPQELTQMGSPVPFVQESGAGPRGPRQVQVNPFPDQFLDHVFQYGAPQAQPPQRERSGQSVALPASPGYPPSGGAQRGAHVSFPPQRLAVSSLVDGSPVQQSQPGFGQRLSLRSGLPLGRPLSPGSDSPRSAGGQAAPARQGRPLERAQSAATPPVSPQRLGSPLDRARAGARRGVDVLLGRRQRGGAQDRQRADSGSPGRPRSGRPDIP